MNAESETHPSFDVNDPMLWEKVNQYMIMKYTGRPVTSVQMYQMYTKSILLHNNHMSDEAFSNQIQTILGYSLSKKNMELLKDWLFYIYVLEIVNPNEKRF